MTMKEGLRMSRARVPRRAWQMVRCLAVACLTAGAFVAAPSAANADANPAPPDLSGTFIIENSNVSSVLLCANSDGVAFGQRLTTTISADCQWQQSGPDNDAYLYNVGMNEVLDVDSGGPLNVGTSLNMQPYYTNPLQSYEQWSWSGFGSGGQALRP